MLPTSARHLAFVVFASSVFSNYLCAQSVFAPEDFCPDAVVAYVKVNSGTEVLRLLKYVANQDAAETQFAYKLVDEQMPYLFRELEMQKEFGGTNYGEFFPNNLLFAFFRNGERLEWLLAFSKSDNDNESIEALSRLFSPVPVVGNTQSFTYKVPSFCLANALNFSPCEISRFQKTEQNGHAVYLAENVPWGWFEKGSYCFVAPVSGISILTQPTTDSTRGIGNSRRHLHSVALRDRQNSKPISKDIEIYVDVLAILDIVKLVSGRDARLSIPIDGMLAISVAIDFGTADSDPKIRAGVLTSQPRRNFLQLSDHFLGGEMIPESFVEPDSPAYIGARIDFPGLVDALDSIAGSGKFSWLDAGLGHANAPFGDLGLSGVANRLGNRMAIFLPTGAPTGNPDWVWAFELKDETSGHQIIESLRGPYNSKDRILVRFDTHDEIELFRNGEIENGKVTVFIMDRYLFVTPSENIAKSLIDNRTNLTVKRFSVESDSCSVIAAISPSIFSGHLNRLKLWGNGGAKPGAQEFREKDNRQIEGYFSVQENGFSLSAVLNHKE